MLGLYGLTIDTCLVQLVHVGFYNFLNLSTVEMGLGWAGAELGFGLNGLHIESCLVCLAFMVDY